LGQIAEEAMMDTNRDEEVTGTVGSIVIQAMSDPRNGPAFIQAYLRAGFLSSSVDALFQARQRAGLTQDDVAKRLGTKQPAIARWEGDTEGSISLRRYVDLALASDAVPLIVLVPKDDVVEFIHANPSAPRTADAYLTWRHQSSEGTISDKGHALASDSGKTAAFFRAWRKRALFGENLEESGRLGAPSLWNAIASQPQFNSSVSVSGTTGNPSPTIMQHADEKDRELVLAQ
jgi:transcriptional regulator with XRE-family HTH domain